MLLLLQLLLLLLRGGRRVDAAVGWNEGSRIPNFRVRFAKLKAKYLHVVTTETVDAPLQNFSHLFFLSMRRISEFAVCSFLHVTGVLRRRRRLFVGTGRRRWNEKLAFNGRFGGGNLSEEEEEEAKKN